MLNTVLALAAERALNTALRLDPIAQAELGGLAGRALGLCIEGVGVEFRITAQPDGLLLIAGSEAEGSEAVIRGMPFSLMRLGLADDPQDNLFSGDIRIRGNLELVREYSALLRRLDPDWEALLAEITGDVIAHKLGGLLRTGHFWRKDSITHLQQDVSDYLREEARVLPNAIELDDWMRGVDAARGAADRLDARIRRIQRQIEVGA